MLKRGIYLAPSAFEALFISSTHTQSLLDKTIGSYGSFTRRDSLAIFTQI